MGEGEGEQKQCRANAVFFSTEFHQSGIWPSDRMEQLVRARRFPRASSRPVLHRSRRVENVSRIIDHRDRESHCVYILLPVLCRGFSIRRVSRRFDRVGTSLHLHEEVRCFCAARAAEDSRAGLGIMDGPSASRAQWHALIGLITVISA